MASKPKVVERDFQEVANEYAKRSIESISEMLAALEHAKACTEGDCKLGADSENPASWHDEESAHQRIYEDPLEVTADKGERFDGTRHYMILLGWGGPAARITGELNEYAEPTSAQFEYQDWFKPWTQANITEKEADAILTYARQFCFES